MCFDDFGFRPSLHCVSIDDIDLLCADGGLCPLSEFGFRAFLDSLEIEDIEGLCEDRALLCELYLAYLECGQ